MSHYIVYAQGVYRHQICGVFSSIDNAKKAAINEALKEYDGYHNFMVAKVAMDEYVDDVKDLFSVSSQDRITKVREVGGIYDPRPVSRKICMYNTDGEHIETLLEMTHGMEIIK